MRILERQKDMQSVNIQLVLDELLLALPSDGFVQFLAQHQLRRQTSFGFEHIVVSLSTYPEVSLLEFFIGLRHELVERTAFQFTNGHKGFAPQSHTLLVPMSLLMGQKILRYHIHKPEDVEAAVAQFKLQFDEVGRAFWKQNQTIDQLHQLFNSKPLEPLPFVPNDFIRCIKGLVISKLVQNPNHDQLEDIYFHKMSNNGTPKELLNNYVRLIGLFRLHSFN